MIALGCDVGALFTKIALIDDEQLVASRILRTTGIIGDELENHVDQLIQERGLARNHIESVGATGRGADLLASAHFTEDEVRCAAAAAAALLPQIELVLHVGGQSIAAIGLDSDGEIANFIRNDKCAAGTGRFLEMMGRKINIEPEEVDGLVKRSTEPTSISNQCVVYAESEAISHLNSGARREDLFAGICQSVARIAISQGRRIRGARTFTVTGGVGRYHAVTSIIRSGLDGEYIPFPLDPTLAPALGVALLDEDESEEDEVHVAG